MKRILFVVSSALLASIVLSACGNSGGGMSDDDKIKLMNKAHDTPIGPSSAPKTGS